MRFTLRSAGPSPYGRKVELAGSLVGLTGDITVEPADTMAAGDSVRQQNPLGKIPALILEDGRVLYDSRVIVEFFDTLAGGGKLIPTDPDARFNVLTAAALADGIIDASILMVYEVRFRPDQTPHAGWLDHQRGKVERGLAAMAASPPSLAPVTVDGIGLACGLGYLDFRKQVDWRAKFPALVNWLDEFAAAVPLFDRTRPDA